jgi:hypothetical protein
MTIDQKERIKYLSDFFIFYFYDNSIKNQILIFKL